MNKPLSMLVGVALAVTGASLHAADPMKPDRGMGMDMKMMDTNNDGMVSREEYMRYHEAAYDRMKKTPGGMVDAKGMSMMQGGMMRDEPAKGAASAASTGAKGNMPGKNTSPGQ